MKTNQKSTSKPSTTSKSTTRSTSAKKSNAQQKIDDDAIRQRAYEIFLQNGSHDNHQNWITAERELMDGM